MEYFSGLDVSLEEASVCVIDETGKVPREGKVLSRPQAIATFLKETESTFERIGLEAGQLAPWPVGWRSSCTPCGWTERSSNGARPAKPPPERPKKGGY